MGNALVSTIKTVVQVVADLDESRKIYEGGLGLVCVGEETTDSFWTLSGKTHRIARFAREGEDFGCVDLIENRNATAQIRDSSRAFDYGIVTLNYRTNNIEKAVERLREHGAEPVSEILSYDVGKPMSELMMNTSTGERLTIIQIGDPTDEEPFFNEAIATAGMVVPEMKTARKFYGEILGLGVSIEFQAKGSPFDKLLGVSTLDKLDFATLTSDGNWTGKVELLELDVPGESAKQTNADGSKTGYWMNTFLSENIENLAGKLSADIVRIERPFHGNCRAFLAKAAGGELIEVVEK